MSIIINADSYKASHYSQYPATTKYISSYVEARGGDYSQVVFFGLQAFIKNYLLQPISEADVEQAQSIIEPHGLPFFKDGWQYILHKYQGYLPLAIEAVAEGSVLDTGNVLCQVVNTDPSCYWLTSYIETALLRGIWYPSTVATRSYMLNKTIKRYLLKTATDTSSLPFMLHDFGARGCSSAETAKLGGMAHLLSFQGSDNLLALLEAQNIYRAKIAGYSIPAAEHSTIISWGEDSEAEAYAHLLNNFNTISIVSDSYDLYNAINNIFGGKLKAVVKKFPGLLVIRPDSGEPLIVVREALKLLAKHFGVVTNDKGYKVLPNNIRLIQGDGVNEVVIEQILQSITEIGFSAENIVFGMGGELLQKLSRDNLGFAMKTSAVNDGNGWVGVAKSPKTDQFKWSRKGRLALVNNTTMPLSDLGARQNQLQTVYHNGELLKDYTWDQIIAGLKQ